MGQEVEKMLVGLTEIRDRAVRSNLSANGKKEADAVELGSSQSRFESCRKHKATQQNRREYEVSK